VGLALRSLTAFFIGFNFLVIPIHSAGPLRSFVIFDQWEHSLLPNQLASCRVRPTEHLSSSVVVVVLDRQLQRHGLSPDVVRYVHAGHPIDYRVLLSRQWC
jgi:hypothetical protein